MKKSLVIITLSFLTFGSAAAQNSQPASFAEFRKGMLDDYNKFRKSILEDYDRFLEAAWRDYEQFKGEDRYSTPKPKTAPVKPVDVTPVDQPVPAPEKPAKPKPWKKAKPAEPALTRPTRPTRPTGLNSPTEPPSPGMPSDGAAFQSFSASIISVGCRHCGDLSVGQASPLS